jgi:hypothetical protein
MTSSIASEITQSESGCTPRFFLSETLHGEWNAAPLDLDRDETTAKREPDGQTMAMNRRRRAILRDALIAIVFAVVVVMLARFLWR